LRWSGFLFFRRGGRFLSSVFLLLQIPPFCGAGQRVQKLFLQRRIIIKINVGQEKD